MFGYHAFSLVRAGSRDGCRQRTHNSSSKEHRGFESHPAHQETDEVAMFINLKKLINVAVADCVIVRWPFAPAQVAKSLNRSTAVHLTGRPATAFSNCCDVCQFEKAGSRGSCGRELVLSFWSTFAACDACTGGTLPHSPGRFLWAESFRLVTPQPPSICCS